MKRKNDLIKLFALDFSASGIKAIAAEIEDDNAIRILSHEMRRADAIRNGIIQQPTGTAFNVTSLLKQLKNSSRIKENIKDFATGIGGKGMKVKQVTHHYSLKRKRKITPKDIDEMALVCENEHQMEIYDILDVIPVSYEVDGYKTNKPEGREGQHIKGYYHLIIGSKEIKTQFHKVLERTPSYEARYTILGPEAFAIAVSEEDERREGCAIIDMGASSTTLTIYQNEIIQYILVVPLGSQNLTKDIQYIKISEAHAEKLKHKFGQALESHVKSIKKIRIPKSDNADESVLIKNSDLAHIIESRLDEIFRPIFYVLNQHKEMIPRGIIISGGGAKLANMTEYIEEKSGFQTRLGDHSGWLTPDTDPQFHDLIYAQIIGIIILAFDEKQDNEKQQLDIFKDKGPKRKKLSDWFTQGIFKFFDEDTSLKTER